MFYNILITIKYYINLIDAIKYYSIFAMLLINNVTFLK